MVGVDVVLLYVGGQAGLALEEERYEGVAAASAGQDALVGGEEDDALEVEVSRLQHAQYLQAHQRFADERDAVACGYAGVYLFQSVDVGHGVGVGTE